MVQLQTKLLQRRDTLTNWINNNPILLDGELGFISINGEYTQMIIGDGKRSFNNLPKINVKNIKNMISINNILLFGLL